VAHVHSGEFFVVIVGKVELIRAAIRINFSRTSTAHAAARSAVARTVAVSVVLVLNVKNWNVMANAFATSAGPLNV